MKIPNKDKCPVCGSSVWKNIHTKVEIDQGKLKIEVPSLNVRPESIGNKLWWRCDSCGAEWNHIEK